MFGDNAVILDGHIPTGEWSHLGAQFQVFIYERGSLHKISLSENPGIRFCGSFTMVNSMKPEACLNVIIWIYYIIKGTICKVKSKNKKAAS